MEQWENQLELFNNRLQSMENTRNAMQMNKDMLTGKVELESQKVSVMSDSYENHLKAIAALSKISEDAITSSFNFIEDSLNEVLAQVFVNSPRKIRLVESMRGQKYPELKIELTAANGIKRDLKTDSGHGIRQMISLLCTLCLICITGTRKFLVLDEVLTGLSREARMAVNDILWSFTSIGFQFVIVEHGFIAKGAKVYKLELNNDVSSVVSEYISEDGYFLSPQEK